MNQPKDNRSRPRIERALDHLPDDMLLEACEEPVARVPRRRLAVWGSLAASLVLVLAGVFMIARLLGDGPTAPPLPAPSTTIAFDVNPSLAIEVSADERVTAVEALNEAAAAVVSDLSVLEAPLDDAVDAIIAALLRHGYLTAAQNSILVSVDTADGAPSDRLQRRIADRIAACLALDEIDASVITQDFDQDEAPPSATDSGASAAKADFIRKILDADIKDAYGTPYTYEQLEPLTIKDLRLLWQNKGLHVSGITLWGESERSDIISPENALSIALTHGGFDAARGVRVQVDYDMLSFIQAPIYQIRLTTATKTHHYCILASTGDILSKSPASNKLGEAIPESFSQTDYCNARVAKRMLGTAVSERHGIRLNDLPLTFKMLDGKYVYYAVFEHEGRRYEYVMDATDGEIITERITLKGDQAS